MRIATFSRKVRDSWVNFYLPWWYKPACWHGKTCKNATVGCKATFLALSVDAQGRHALLKTTAKWMGMGEAQHAHTAFFAFLHTFTPSNSNKCHKKAPKGSWTVKWHCSDGFQVVWACGQCTMSLQAHSQGKRAALHFGAAHTTGATQWQRS